MKESKQLWPQKQAIFRNRIPRTETETELLLDVQDQK